MDGFRACLAVYFNLREERLDQLCLVESGGLYVVASRSYALHSDHNHIEHARQSNSRFL